MEANLNAGGHEKETIHNTPTTTPSIYTHLPITGTRSGLYLYGALGISSRHIGRFSIDD
jgi:hypothetical protein